MFDITTLTPILKTLGYTGPATLGVILAAAGSYLYKTYKPSAITQAEKGMRDDLSQRIDNLDLKVGRLERRIEEITSERERETFRADGWYWHAQGARRVAEKLVHDHTLPALEPWPPDPDPSHRRV